MPKRKKRSKRGKLLLSLVYIILCCLIIIILKHAKDAFINTKEEVLSPGVLPKDNGRDISINKNEHNNIGITESELIEKLISLVGKIPYERGGKCDIAKNNITVNTLDSFGLVDYMYACVFGQHLAEAGITESELSNCEVITHDNLKIGDVAVFDAGANSIYGIYIGCYGSYPLYVYCWDIPLKNKETGYVCLSYNKEECNDLFGGMYPIVFNRYVRLPGFDFNRNMSDNIEEKIQYAKILMSEKEHNYASAAYRIGEWIRAKDYEQLMSRLNNNILDNYGIALNDIAFTDYINRFSELIGNNNYFFRLMDYHVYDNYAILFSEIVKIDSEYGYERTGDYYELTVYDDGSYLPGSVFGLPKVYTLYGFQDKDTPATGVENDIIYDVPVLDNYEIQDDEYIIKGDGYSIDLRQFYE